MKNIFAKNVEEEALKQFDECCSHDFVLQSALMPDVHTGYVAPIGSVIKTKGVVVPSWVGYDIGCGMIAIKISDQKADQMTLKEKSQDLFNQINRDIPMGAGRHNSHGDTVELLPQIEKELEILKQKLNGREDDMFAYTEKVTSKNLGTLGSGNHFIEILTYEDESWLVIHSGSRGVGHAIGTHFMKKASGNQKGFEVTEGLKEQEDVKTYMLFQNYCLQFALLNRLSMAVKVENAVRNICGIDYDTDDNLWTNKNHNHCVRDEDDTFIHRKGATTSHKGERGVIPANMRDGCILVMGLGNPDFLHSSSHGAGRMMSRTKARDNITMETFQKQMDGIVAPVKQKVIDESPDAYKNISEVMEQQLESVEIVKHLKPIINWKGF